MEAPRRGSKPAVMARAAERPKPGGVVHPRSGSKPARNRFSGQLGPRRAEIFAPPGQGPWLLHRPPSPTSGCSELQPILLGFADIVVEAAPEVL